MQYTWANVPLSSTWYSNVCVTDWIKSPPTKEFDKDRRVDSTLKKEAGYWGLLQNSMDVFSVALQPYASIADRKPVVFSIKLRVIQAHIHNWYCTVLTGSLRNTFNCGMMLCIEKDCYLDVTTTLMKEMECKLPVGPVARYHSRTAVLFVVIHCKQHPTSLYNQEMTPSDTKTK